LKLNTPALLDACDWFCRNVLNLSACHVLFVEGHQLSANSVNTGIRHVISVFGNVGSKKWFQQLASPKTDKKIKN